MGVISGSVPDWSRETIREFWDPGRKLLYSIRQYQRLKERYGLIVRGLRAVCVVRHRFWSAVSGADIPLEAKIGGGLLIPHPNGIVIHPEAIVGPNCLILQQVTLGTIDGGAPIICGHVDIGAGAKVLGSIKVGEHSKIGANAVVVQDVSPNSIATGIPAHQRPDSNARGRSEQ